MLYYDAGHSVLIMVHDIVCYIMIQDIVSCIMIQDIVCYIMTRLTVLLIPSYSSNHPQCEQHKQCVPMDEAETYQDIMISKHINFYTKMTWHMLQCTFHHNSFLYSTKKPVTTMLTYPWKCTVLHCNHLETTGADDLTL